MFCMSVPFSCHMFMAIGILMTVISLGEAMVSCNYINQFREMYCDFVGQILFLASLFYFILDARFFNNYELLRHFCIFRSSRYLYFYVSAIYLSVHIVVFQVENFPSKPHHGKMLKVCDFTR